MKSKNVETLIRERAELRDLLEDIMDRIQEFREEMVTELDDLEDMIAENGGIGFHWFDKKSTFNLYFFLT